MHSEKKKNRFEIDMCNGSIMNKLISFNSADDIWNSAACI